MFDTIVSKISNLARRAVRTLEAGIRRSPLLATAAALLALLLFVW